MPRKISLSTLLFVAALVFAMIGAGPASAQNKRPDRYVRVTTGSVKVTGWEQGIIQANPNLSHFTWMPMSSNTQGYRKIPAGGVAPGGQPLPPKNAGPAYQHVPTQVTGGPRYVKPIHVDTDVAAKPFYTKPIHVDTEVAAKPIYTKPIQVDTEVSGKPFYTKPLRASEAGDQRGYLNGQLKLPQREEQRVGALLRSNGQPDEQVSGRLSRRPQSDEQVSGRLRSQPSQQKANPEVATYAPMGAPRGQDGRGQLTESKEVYGKITRH